MNSRLGPAVKWMRVDDGIVVYIPSAERFADLNDSAAEIFEALRESDWSTELVSAQLSAQYGMNVPAAREAVDSVVSHLRSLDIMVAE